MKKHLRNAKHLCFKSCSLCMLSEFPASGCCWKLCVTLLVGVFRTLTPERFPAAVLFTKLMWHRPVLSPECSALSQTPALFHSSDWLHSVHFKASVCGTQRTLGPNSRLNKHTDQRLSDASAATEDEVKFSRSVRLQKETVSSGLQQHFCWLVPVCFTGSQGASSESMMVI